METVLQDVRYALRQLGKLPWFTVAAVLTLALGIGPNAAIFSAVYTLLLRSLPFQSADRIVGKPDVKVRPVVKPQPARLARHAVERCKAEFRSCIVKRRHISR